MSQLFKGLDTICLTIWRKPLSVCENKEMTSLQHNTVSSDKLADAVMWKIRILDLKKNICDRKSGPAMAGLAGPPTTALISDSKTSLINKTITIPWKYKYCMVRK